MKQAVRILVVFFVFVVAVIGVGQAKVYPKYFDDNQDLILITGRMGLAFYVDRSSLVVEEYEPPQYIITVNVVRIEFPQKREPNGELSRKGAEIVAVDPYRFFYNYDKQLMFIDKNRTDNWLYLPARDPSERGLPVGRLAGEMAFALAYNMSFYGKKMYSYDDFYPKGVKVK